MKPSIFFSLILFSYLLSFTGHASFNLSEDELKALDNLGVSQEKLGDMINKSDFSEIKEKLDEAQINEEGLAEAKERAQEYVDQKSQKELGRVQERLNQKREELTQDATKIADGAIKDADGLIFGYAASTISLTMLGVFAPSVVMTCRTKPSALIYAGTAAIYIVRELQNSKKFKLSALGEIEVVKMKIDKDKSINSNLETAQEALDMQFQFINSYKNVLDKGFQSIQDKAKNARLASMGFMAAAGVALAETYAFDMGACVAATKWEPQSEKSQKYASRIDKSKSMLEAYALYDEWERIARGEKKSLSLEEYQRLSFLNSYQDELDYKEILKTSMKLASQVFFPPIHANDQITVEKQVVSEDLKNNKLLDYAADADKVLGVLLGGVSFAAASFIPWYGNFLKKIVASGTSRAVVFGAHGAIALYASQQLGESSEKMLQRLNQLQEIIDEVQKHGNKILSEVKNGVNSDELAQVGQVLGFNPDRPIGEMSIHEADQAIRDIEKDEVKDNLKDMLEDQVKEKVEEKVEEKMPSAFLQKIRDFFLSPAYAQSPGGNSFRFRCYTPGKCAPPTFPRFREKNLAPLNEFFHEYQLYGSTVFQEQPERLRQIQTQLEKREDSLNRWRGHTQQALNQQRVAKGHRPIDFRSQESAEAINILQGISPHMRSKALPAHETTGKKMAQQSSSPQQISPHAASEKSVNRPARGISALDYMVLQGLIERLDRSAQPHMNKKYEFSPIHPKEVPLFEAIHRRYQIVFSRAESP